MIAARKFSAELVKNLSLPRLSCAFVQGCKQGGRSLRGSTQIGDVLPLDRVHAVRILYIGKVDDIKLHLLGNVPQHLVLIEVIESHLCQGRKLVVIDNERKAFG